MAAPVPAMMAPPSSAAPAAAGPAAAGPVLLGGRVASKCCIGQEMHNRIPADEWCVTKRDLRFLRREVQRAIREGVIRPTQRDNFAATDLEYGPTIYTVTEQFIKPITRDAGGMSWALMRNPGGLKCDIFVTHAWQEGVFEFLEKVLDSWPRGRKHIWCCMLSNPQNLNIAKLIQRPSESPFAIALRSASCMLVVPNQHSSIYTRLWCAYEAFLAWEAEKVILTATASHKKRIWRTVPVAALCGLAGYIAAKNRFLVSDQLSGPVTITVFVLAWYPLILLAALVRSSIWRRFWNCFGTFWSALSLGLLLDSYQGHSTIVASFPSKKEEIHADWRNILFQLTFSTIVFFITSEIDRARSEVQVEEAEKLIAGFSGTIENARCTRASDEAAIRQEIGDRVASVDYSINVLIQAGMSTPDLRQAAELGVDVSSFSHFSFAFMVFSNCTSFPHDLDWNGGGFDRITTVLNFVGCIFAIVWMVFISRSPPDKRIFSYQVLQRLCLTVCWPPWYVMGFLWQAGVTDAATTLLVIQCSGPIMWMLVLPLSFAGLFRLAQLPWCGPKLAQLFVLRGCRSLVCSRSQRERIFTDSTNNATSNSSDQSSIGSDSKSNGDEEQGCKKISRM